MNDLIDTLNSISSVYHLPVVVSTHPRTKKRIESMQLDHISEHIKFLKPFGFHDYNKLQMSAKCVISDSGTITEETSILNLPAITIRNAHERPEGMDSGTLIMSGLKSDQVLNAIKIVLAQHSRSNFEHTPVEDYDAGLVSTKILRGVMSYIPYVNRVVWSK